MATATLPRSSSRPQRARPDLTEVAVFGLVLAAALAFLLPVLAVALPVALVCLVGTRRGWWPAWLPVLVGVAVAVPWALWLRAHGGVEAAVQAYVAVQQDALAQLLVGNTTPPAFAQILSSYTTVVWPYAVPGGAVLGAWGAFFLTTLSFSDRTNAFPGAALAFHDAGRLAQAPEQAIDWALPNVVGRGVLTLLSAPPGLGKGFWTWGLLRAMQDGAAFYGVRVRRPVRPARWLRSERPLKVLWLTEEGESFARTARRFGIAPGLVDVLRRDQVRLSAWPEIVRAVRREAWRRGCAYVVVDTVRAWCPQAEVSNDGAAEVMNLARAEWAEPGLGVLFVHHDRKGGGEYGEGVAGAYNLVGSVDVLVQLSRVKDRPDARRMVVSRRFGDLDLTARLDGVRYVVDDDDDAADAAPPPPDPIPDHLIATLEAICAAGEDGLTRTAVQTATGVPATTVNARLLALEELGRITRSGSGRKGDPLVWRSVEAEAPTLAPTADPAYVRYLGSKEWAQKRREILDRAAGRCEECGAPTEERELEVHHKTYERAGAELPEDLIALDPGCHRRAHAKPAT